MRFALDDEQAALRDSARAFVAGYAGEARRVTEGGKPTAELWGAMAALGWPAIGIPEEYGGIGLGAVERAVILEELGRVLLPCPFFASNALAATFLLRGGSEAQKLAWLPRLASGEVVGTVGWNVATSGAGSASTTAAASAAGLTRFSGVPHGGSATLLLLVTADGAWLCEGGARQSVHNTLDRTRELASVEVDLQSCEPLPGGTAAWALALAEARIALAAESVGVSERSLDLAVEYAKVRRQFGRPIGSFQAIKHKCADLAVLVESARSTAWWAAWTVEGSPAELESAALVASAVCSEAAFRCAADALQIFGGIGFTWEHDIHLYLKRARANGALLGPPHAARAALAAELGI